MYLVIINRGYFPYFSIKTLKSYLGCTYLISNHNSFCGEKLWEIDGDGGEGVTGKGSS